MEEIIKLRVMIANIDWNIDYIISSQYLVHLGVMYQICVSLFKSIKQYQLNSINININN